ncbi:MAG: hypothetical protein HY431_02845 [Candidatus Levybacteria bacterium]|nr:hypothetical protein [Candidatus Levybacteria bacterium]
MGDNIPDGAREMIAQFKQEEARRAAERVAQRGEITRSKDRRQPKKRMNPREVEAHAMQFGIVAETTGANHGKHLVAPNGARCSLPDHPRDLATGTLQEIKKFIAQNGVTPAKK